jgi:hypothetical protein
MVRIRQGWLVVMLGLGLLAACKKDEKSSSASGDKSAEKADQGGVASGDDLALLPVDSEAVIGINFAQVQRSSLWKQFVEPKMMSGQMRQLNDLKAKCGYDPMTSVKSVSIGVKSGPDRNKPNGVLVVHGADKAKANQCVDAMKDEMAKHGTQMTRDGDVWLFTNTQGGPPAAVTFVNDSTVVAVFGENASAATLKTVTAGGSKLKDSDGFVKRYKKVNTGDSVWMLVHGKVLESIPGKPKAAFGSLNVTDGLAVDFRIQFENADAAAQAASLTTTQAKQAQAYVDKAEFTSDGDELHAQIVMSSQKLQALVSQLGGLLGAFGGMGGGMGNP